MKENSMEETIKTIEKMIKSYKEADECGLSNNDFKNEIKALSNILSDYKRLQEEFKEVDHECERLEEKEVRLIKENEYYEDLINALETYYEITRKDLEECIKNDK